eukprot:TRINITY_DN21931_c0_g1_i1.p1 TRINITY_DN21931_c0_g1~~TRINITY_DN21931_c0_g1_i1.p1  ORF type:complete len:526 (+),score=53.29 TRINITY_DN21931_c0_g1_i1:310-1887(+)
MEEMVAAGLNQRPLADIAASVAEMGFNCVRLTFSLKLVLGNETHIPDPQSIAANPALQGLSPLRVFDATVAALSSAGLLVVLNNHMSAPGWCCDGDDAEGLWYTAEYPEESWLQALGLMAARYRNDLRVVGFDLRNELRPAHSITPTWGSGDPQSDWSIAAQKGGERVLANNPPMLIIISGLNYGMYLCDVPRRPIHASIPALREHVIYTSHEYPWFNLNLVCHYALETCLIVLAVTCGIVWIIMASLYQFRKFCNRGPAPAWQWEDTSHRTLCKAYRCSLVAASLLTCLSLVFLVLGELLIQPCDVYRDYIIAFLLASAFLTGFGGMLVWLRVMLAFTAHYRMVRKSTSDGEHGSGLITQICPCYSRKSRAATVSPTPDAQCTQSRKGALSRFVAALGSTSCLTISMPILLIGVTTWIWFERGTYDTFASELDKRWGFVLDGSEGMAPAPVWLGEFGTNNNNLWWKHLMRYLQERDVDWAYWSLNGEMRLEENETYGIWSMDSKHVRHPWKLADLQKLMVETPS